VQIEMRAELAADLRNDGKRAIRDWSNSAAFAIRSVRWSASTPQGAATVVEWSNDEMNKPRPPETETDMAKRDVQAHARDLRRERTPPASKSTRRRPSPLRKDIEWQAAPAFQMDFRAENFRWRKA
jgi:peptide/nickel transport system substrate-binding protein